MENFNSEHGLYDFQYETTTDQIKEWLKTSKEEHPKLTIKDPIADKPLQIGTFQKRSQIRRVWNSIPYLRKTLSGERIMYRVTFQQLIEILKKGDCTVALTEIKKNDLTPQKIETIEVNFTINDPDTEYEVLTVTELNIYTKETILFGISLKHTADFLLQNIRREPEKNYKVLKGDINIPSVNQKDMKTMKETTNIIKEAMTKTSNLSRIVEKMGVGEDLDIINKHINEIYKTLKGTPNGNSN